MRRDRSLTALGRWCRQRRMSYDELAERTGISRRALVYIATGERAPAEAMFEPLMRETKLPRALLTRTVR